MDSEELLVDGCETLNSAKVMANDFPGPMDGLQRHVLSRIAQLIMLGGPAVNRVPDNLQLKAEAPLSPEQRKTRRSNQPERRVLSFQALIKPCQPSTNDHSTCR
ncbi:DUF6124 family protein [Pseudomonas sp. SCPG-7]|uniref:DUF6124 family protein n=1 Tax=Pseudomonas TaxID=286 RepID=UPI00353158AA